MKTKYLALIILFFFVLSGHSYGQVKYQFTQKPVDIAKWIEDNFKKGKNPPFSFVYGDKQSKDLLRKWNFSSEKTRNSEAGVTTYSYTWIDKECERISRL